MGYLSRPLSGKRIHYFLHPIVCEDGTVEQKVGGCDFVSIDEVAVGQQGVPVVKVVELQGDAVTVLELLGEEQSGIELQLE